MIYTIPTSIMDRINLIGDLDYLSLLRSGITQGFIYSISVGLIALGINYCLKLLES